MVCFLLARVYAELRRCKCEPILLAGMSAADYEESRHYDEVDLAMTDAYGDDWADEEDAFDNEP